METHTVTRASATESARARPGRVDTSRAAAGGPTMSAKVNRAPTTGTVNAVANASVRRNTVSVSVTRTPRTSANAGDTDVKSNGRKSIATVARHTAPSTTTGTISLVLTPRISPKSRAFTPASYSVLNVKNAAPSASISTRDS